MGRNSLAGDIDRAFVVDFLAKEAVTTVGPRSKKIITIVIRVVVLIEGRRLKIFPDDEALLCMINLRQLF